MTVIKSAAAFDITRTAERENVVFALRFHMRGGRDVREALFHNLLHTDSRKNTVFCAFGTVINYVE